MRQYEDVNLCNLSIINTVQKLKLLHQNNNNPNFAETTRLNVISRQAKIINVTQSFDIPIAQRMRGIDIITDTAKLGNGIADLLFWGVETPNQSGRHQSIMWCCPRFNGRGDNSIYNRSFIGLKTIIAVFGGFSNSPIAKASIETNTSIFSTFFGDQNSWSLALFNCFRPFCFKLQGVSHA
ncbi:MAG: hypothetical protein NWP91_06140 [Rickettsiaceae bacterium]|nr:hypothetical protein [Rickettsiaceae bacterium]